jgi:hypothetical protein
MSTATIEKSLTEWVSAREASRVTGFALHIIKRLAAEGFLTTRKSVVGSPVRYSRASCEQVRDSAVVPASKTLSASA